MIKIENNEIPKTVGPYTVINKIGQGAFSVVYQAYNTETLEIVALKYVKRDSLRDPLVFKHFERELRLSESLKHKNIVSFHQIYYLNDFIVLSMECLGNGTLENYRCALVFQIDNYFYVKWAKDILEGLDYLHQKKIAHHDIKLDNIGFDNLMTAKIIDLGLCEEFNDFCYDKNGTILYNAPEIFYKSKYDGTKADIWSFGVSFHYLITGELPFNHIYITKNCINPNDFSGKIINKVVGELKYLIDLSLTVDPVKRPSAKDLLNLKLFRDFNEPIEQSRFPKRNKVVNSYKGLIVVSSVKKRRFIKKGNSEGFYRTRRPNLF